MEPDFEFNKDEARRNGLLGIVKGESNWGGVIHFQNLTAEILKTLLDEKLADPEETQNEAPSIQEFYDFLVENPGYTAHGYAVDLERDDYRISIEGVEGCAETEEGRSAFIEMFRFADDFTFAVDWQYCWFD